MTKKYTEQIQDKYYSYLSSYIRNQLIKKVVSSKKLDEYTKDYKIKSFVLNWLTVGQFLTGC